MRSGSQDRCAPFTPRAAALSDGHAMSGRKGWRKAEGGESTGSRKRHDRSGQLPQLSGHGEAVQHRAASLVGQGTLIGTRRASLWPGTAGAAAGRPGQRYGAGRGRAGLAAVRLMPPPMEAPGTRTNPVAAGCRESVAEECTPRLVQAIGSVEPDHAIAIGHVQWSSVAHLPSVAHYSGFGPAASARLLDFVTIHFYPLARPRLCNGPESIERNARYLRAVLAECLAMGKPVMIGQFGWYGVGPIRHGGHIIMPAQAWQDQVRWNEELIEVSRGRVCGCLHGAFADRSSSHDLTRWSGLGTEQLGLQPSGRRFIQLAAELKSRRHPTGHCRNQTGSTHPSALSRRPLLRPPVGSDSSSPKRRRMHFRAR